MADLDGTPGVGETHRRTQKYRDDGDGTKSTVNAANLWGWDNTTGAWSKLLVDHATGFLAVASSGGGGGGGTVSIAANQTIAVTNAGTFAVQNSIPVSIAGGQTVALAAGTAIFGALSAGVSIVSGQTVGLAAGSQLIGSLVNPVSIAGSQTVGLAAGSAAIGTVSIAANQSVINAPSTSGGITVASGSIGNAATAVKAGAGQVYGYHFYNNNPTQSYVQFYNLSTTNTSVGTAPTASLGIPANSGAAVQFDIGWAFSTAITIAICTTRGGSTSPTNTVDFNVFYD